MTSTIACTGLSLDCHTDEKDHKPRCTYKQATNPATPITCHLTNVCLEKNTILVYNPNKTPALDAFNNVKLHLDAMTPEGHLDFRIISDVIDSTTMTWSTIPAVASLGSSFYNIGHVWGDAIWPAFQILNTFGADKYDFQYIFFKDVEVHKALYELVSNNPILESTNIRKCYSHLYAGNDMSFSYSYGNPNPQALMNFRDFVLRKMKIPLMRASDEPSILFIKKHIEFADSKSFIKNFDEVVHSTRIKFPSSIVTTASWYGMPYEQQFQIMMNADIVVTLPGSDLMNGLFMKSGSSAIVYCRYVNVVEKSNEVRIWFQALPDYQVFEVCGDEDMKFEDKVVTLRVKSVESFIKIAISEWKHRKIANKSHSIF